MLQIQDPGKHSLELQEWEPFYSRNLEGYLVESRIERWPLLFFLGVLYMEERVN